MVGERNVAQFDDRLQRRTFQSGILQRKQNRLTTRLVENSRRIWLIKCPWKRWTWTYKEEGPKNDLKKARVSEEDIWKLLKNPQKQRTGGFWRWREAPGTIWPNSSSLLDAARDLCFEPNRVAFKRTQTAATELRTDRSSPSTMCWQSHQVVNPGVSPPTPAPPAPSAWRTAATASPPTAPPVSMLRTFQKGDGQQGGLQKRSTIISRDNALYLTS